ncbi:hypothetical protein MCUN1_001602 [Malassezia cuniculi]|uniref:Protein-tyrosine-phosphatase n=1 Tax=Malassezia cuniculi TaxID=948313 RepID=A0AAF0EQ23_9BASI|nr:hypothetical protein MCUN1_001602 [Malassezia cuniculi]
MQIWGLDHRNIDSYPRISDEVDDSDAPPIRGLSAAQFTELYDMYTASEVPHNVVFPYLHCSDSKNIAQNLFFGATTRGALAPSYRGLTIVRAGSPDSSVLISSVAPEELLEGSSFIRAANAPGISLRNFSAQCVAYAGISDIVVYAPGGVNQATLSLAQRFRTAQKQLLADRQSRGLGGLTYNVFVINEPFAELERVCPHLVAINSSGEEVQHIDFMERERFEINTLSRVSEILPGLWLGPSQTDDTQFSIILRATDDALLPPPSYLDGIAERFAAYDNGKLAAPPKVHLDVPCGLGSFEPGSLNELTQFASCLVEVCAWLYDLTHPNGALKNPRRVLIHCADGYTESSVLALAYLMYAERLSLADAYVDLQLRANRSFFVYPSDLLLLQAIETHISLQLPPEERSRGNASGPAAWLAAPHFDGSFPSRIFPFLYLGSLTHAINAPMLERLGITHVVSVGESALSCSAQLAEACAAGRMSVLELKNVMDDGIDSLRSVMCECVEYIEAARVAGGCVLVHCRVGVSRSSTIALAYVMAHLDLNLVESYLFVRSRRLNILIQPNLLFFWELRGWETFLLRQKNGGTLKVDIGAGRRDATDTIFSHFLPSPGVRPTWGFLCREIAALNARYAV